MGEFVISNDELGQLAKIISSKSMIKISTQYLGLEEDDVVQITKDSEWKVNYKILELWRKKVDTKATREVSNKF